MLNNINDKIKVYVDSGATSKKFMNRYSEVCHFYQYPYDSPDRPKFSKVKLAYPSEAQWGDGNITWGEDDFTWGDYIGSEKLLEIKKIVGLGDDNRRDCLHLDSAYKTGCNIFLTSDKKDIWINRSKIKNLIVIEIFCIFEEEDKFVEYIKQSF
ncbi:MAG: hypothetical protein ABIF12_02030 [bacterium]